MISPEFLFSNSNKGNNLLEPSGNCIFSISGNLQNTWFEAFPTLTLAKTLFLLAPKRKGSMSMTLENSPDLFHNNKKVFFSSSAFRSHHFSSSMWHYCNEALWVAEINSFQSINVLNFKATETDSQ